jgi:hypothetical protein
MNADDISQIPVFGPFYRPEIPSKATPFDTTSLAAMEAAESPENRLFRAILAKLESLKSAGLADRHN